MQSSRKLYWKMKTTSTSESLEKEGRPLDAHANAGSCEIDVGENEDNGKGKCSNLKGRDLYQCVTGNCGFVANNSESFKEHVSTCKLITGSPNLSCAHCERKMKTTANLLEHTKVHGEKKQVCFLCNFKCWTGGVITKHVKTVHRVMSHKLVKKEVHRDKLDPDIVAYPEECMAKSLFSVDDFENGYHYLAKKVAYSFDNIEKLPLHKIFSSQLYCAVCPYSTKVRSNMVRHTEMHKLAIQDATVVVPQAERINPVPYLSRGEGLEFDKMINLAASSHETVGTEAESYNDKVPQFVEEDFRYACSICDHITSDDSQLQAHMKSNHGEVSLYKCPHCQKKPESKDNPDNTVPIDKIAFHMKLHGQKLYMCGHCMMVHYQARPIEKHMLEKHPEKKQIHYLIRDLDHDGVPLAQQSLNVSVSSEKWKCFLCSSKHVFGSWTEARAHCEAVHKVPQQFMCFLCGFSTDDMTKMLVHCWETCRDEDKEKKILVMFSKCETFDAEDPTKTTPIWKRKAGAVRHIHGNFTQDSFVLIGQYSNQQCELPTLYSIETASTSSVPTKNLVKTRVAPSTSNTKVHVGKPTLLKPCTSASFEKASTSSVPIRNEAKRTAATAKTKAPIGGSTSTKPSTFSSVGKASTSSVPNKNQITVPAASKTTRRIRGCTPTKSSTISSFGSYSTLSVSNKNQVKSTVKAASQAKARTSTKPSTLSSLGKESTSPVPSKSHLKPSVLSASKTAGRIRDSTPPTKPSPMKFEFDSPTSMDPPLIQDVFKYQCHKCDLYKTKSPKQLRIHLFNEFRYKRWVCLVCGTKFTTEKSLKGHIERDHHKEYQPNLYHLQPKNMEIEDEIEECIEKQNRKRKMIVSHSVEKRGRLTCVHCNEDGYTYETFEAHILQNHSS